MCSSDLTATVGKPPASAGGGSGAAQPGLVAAGGSGVGQDEEKPLSWRYPVSGDVLEVKENPAVHVDPQGGYHSRPFFSIVLAAYNQGKFIDETVKSVLSQSYDRWEMILVNDGSSDDSWEKANAIMAKHPSIRLRLVNKRNGGLADARNVGLRYAKGSWLCMLDSDDLLGRDYLHRAADFVREDADVDIVPGCMRNFDAVSNDWCFPEGFSIVGIAHWNKFHASVLMRRTLMQKVGGYDPGIPWGLEDWNYWLHAAVYNPTVRFVPEITFYYRHHLGTSMRKKMFALYLEETKSMVRTNHPELYEPVQILHDHDVISEMSPDTLKKLESKIAAYPTLAMPYFWRALYRSRQQQYDHAIEDLTTASQLATGRLLWQIYYHQALIHEAEGRLEEAARAINAAFHHAYFDEILQTKHRIEVALKSANAGRPVVSGHHVLATPTYWSDVKEQNDIRKGTLAGKLLKLTALEGSMKDFMSARASMLALLSTAANSPCPPFRGDRDQDEINLVRNAYFEEESDSWYGYGKGFRTEVHPARAGTESAFSAVMTNQDDQEQSGAMQVVHVRQEDAAPLLVRLWSKAKGVSGGADGGYSLYIDINYVDDSHEWGVIMPFDTGSHSWQRRGVYLDKEKPIASLDVYCMFRYHTGTVWFDDAVVTEARKSTCQCRPNEVYDPGPTADCSPCPDDHKCMLGDSFEDLDL